MNYGSFSDAIRAGAALRPQAFGLLRRGNATCAIGAGLDAMGDYDLLINNRRYNYTERLIAAFPYMETVTRCPVPDCAFGPFDRSLTQVVAHLNDQHKCAREAIADWLRSEEDRLGYVTISEVETAPQTALVPQPACVG